MADDLGHTSHVGKRGEAARGQVKGYVGRGGEAFCVILRKALSACRRKDDDSLRLQRFLCAPPLLMNG